MKLVKLLEKNYFKVFDFFYECKWYMVFAFGLFSLFFLIGFTFPIFFRAEIFSMLQEMVSQIESKGAFELAGFIFLNNMKVSLLAILLGIGFGIFPFIISVFNGYLIGFVSRESVGMDGIGILWRLLPHGIFELPAVIFSIGIGMKIGVELFNRKNNREKLRKNYREALRFYFFVIFPLLLIAGIIEGLLIWYIS
ncbi:MAG: stage II sporulation protein M [Nanoarchaeota archaeon]|nr:stage II sporulation protein M [Nanoarchaeota archaeon]